MYLPEEAMAKAGFWSPPPRRDRALRHIRLCMQDQAVLTPGPGLPELVEHLFHLHKSSPERVLELTAKSALAVAAPMLRWMRTQERPAKPDLSAMPVAQAAVALSHN
jgi:hypothetical protein